MQKIKLSETEKEELKKHRDKIMQSTDIAEKDPTLGFSLGYIFGILDRLTE